MKIAQVAPSPYPQIGRAETRVRRLTQGCTAAGEQVTVITHRLGKALAQEWVGKVQVLRFPHAVSSRNYQVSPAMFRYLKSHAADFDVVQGHNYHSIVGRAIMALDVGGLQDVVTQGVTGLRVPPGDRGTLAVALDNVLGNPEEQRRLAERGRVHARQFEAAAVGRRVVKIFEDAILNRADTHGNRR
jgi:hypothetical protein